MYEENLSEDFNSYIKDYSDPAPFSLSVESLQASDIPAFLNLQQTAYDMLPERQKHFLKLRDAADLISHWEARMPILGIKDINGNLIAQALVAYPANEEAVKNLDGYPINGDKSITAVVQSLCVAPGMAGKGLAQMILDQAKILAAMESHVSLIAKVAQDNTGSGKSFLKSGFALAATGVDPKAGYSVGYWKYAIGHQECSAASPPLALAS